MARVSGRLLLRSRGALSSTRTPGTWGREVLARFGGGAATAPEIDRPACPCGPAANGRSGETGQHPRPSGSGLRRPVAVLGLDAGEGGLDGTPGARRRQLQSSRAAATGAGLGQEPTGRRAVAIPRPRPERTCRSGSAAPVDGADGRGPLQTLRRRCGRPRRWQCPGHRGGGAEGEPALAVALTPVRMEAQGSARPTAARRWTARARRGRAGRAGPLRALNPRRRQRGRR